MHTTNKRKEEKKYIYGVLRFSWTVGRIRRKVRKDEVHRLDGVMVQIIVVIGNAYF